MRNLMLVLPLLALAACSASTNDDGPAAADDALVSGGVCAPLDYGKNAPASEYYKFFADDAEASAFFTRVTADGSLAAFTGPGATFREISHDEMLTRLVAEVFTGFQRAFPRETRGLSTPPPVAVIVSDVKNAYALGGGFGGEARAPWVFVVHTGILKGGFSEAELRGVFAHELGHLILRTFTPEVQKRVRAIYQIGPEGEDGYLGAAQDDDPAIAAHVDAILERQARVGSIVTLGIPEITKGQYGKVLDAFLAHAPPSQACTDHATHAEALKDLQVSLLPNAAAGLLVPAEPTAEQRAELDRLTDLVTSELRTCLAGVNEEATLTEMATALGHEPLAEEQTIDAEEGGKLSFVERILRAEAVLRQQLIELRADPAYPIDRIRVFDYEEDADDASVRVQKAIGLEPTTVGDFLLDALMTPADKAKCIADVAAGRPVPYGQFLDTHQPSCWRYYHVHQFAKALETCPAAPVAPRTPTTLR